MLCLLSLTACISPPSYNTDRQFSTAEEITRWQAKGKLGIRLPNESKAVNFIWQQNGDNFKIQLYGTLGLGNITLEQKKDKATLLTSNGKQSAESAEQLIRDVIGTTIPVDALKSWMKGIPTHLSGHLATPDEIQLNDDGTLKSLTQSNWQVEYRTYHGGNPIALPRKIIASHDDARITLVIKNWEY